MMALVLGCGKVLVGSGWAISLLITNSLRMWSSHLVGAPFFYCRLTTI